MPEREQKTEEWSGRMNWKMVHELEIAVDFLYTGMGKLHQLGDFHKESEDYAFLYHLTVGMERIQKVLIILAENINEEESRLFLKQKEEPIELHKRIKEQTGTAFSKEQECYLNLLSHFYQGEIAEKQSMSSDFSKQTIITYINGQMTDVCTNIQGFLDSTNHMEEIRKELEEMNNSISIQYLLLIEKAAYQRKWYTFKQRCSIVREKYRNLLEKNQSVQDRRILERRAVLELIIYLFHHLDNSVYADYLKRITPLPFHKDLIQEYIADLCNLIISDAVLEEIENRYGIDREWSEKRSRMVDFLGEKGIVFEMEEEIAVSY